MSETEDISTVTGTIPVTDAAELAGCDTPKRARKFREKLIELHDEKGDVLFRYSSARNAPYWTTMAVLRREFPGIFGEPAESNGLDVIELRRQVSDLQKRVGRLEMAARAG